MQNTKHATGKTLGHPLASLLDTSGDITLSSNGSRQNIGATWSVHSCPRVLTACARCGGARGGGGTWQLANLFGRPETVSQECSSFRASREPYHTSCGPECVTQRDSDRFRPRRSPEGQHSALLQQKRRSCGTHPLALRVWITSRP